jgi:hypothetical protein
MSVDLDDYPLLDGEVTPVTIFSLDGEGGSLETTLDATPLRI